MRIGAAMTSYLPRNRCLQISSKPSETIRYGFGFAVRGALFPADGGRHICRCQRSRSKACPLVFEDRASFRVHLRSVGCASADLPRHCGPGLAPIAIFDRDLPASNHNQKAGRDHEHD